jgi:hypothetical protein
MSEEVGWSNKYYVIMVSMCLCPKYSYTFVLSDHILFFQVHGRAHALHGSLEDGYFSILGKNIHSLWNAYASVHSAFYQDWIMLP